MQKIAYSSQADSLYIHLSQLYADLKLRHQTQKIEMIEYKHKANYWETQFHQLKKREDELASELEGLKAKLRKREQQLFGNKSEKNTTLTEKNPNITTYPETSPKKRGQQPGSAGHG